MSLDIDYSIGRIERETGITKDVLRMWERRYAFPNPIRSASGERVYSTQDLERLLLVKRLMDIGHRPGRLMKVSNEQLRAMLVTPADAKTHHHGDEVSCIISYLATNQLEALSQRFDYWIMRYGMEAFMLSLLPELMVAIGNRWQVGDISVYQEHIVSEILQNKLRQPLPFLAGHDQAPTVLLATLPEEQHGLGLLVCDVLLRLEGVRPINAGVQLPVNSIVQAATANKVNILCLSLSEVTNVSTSTQQLIELTKSLPRSTRIVLGGEGAKKIQIDDDRILIASGAQDLIVLIKQMMS